MVSLGTYLVTRLQVSKELRDNVHVLCNKHKGLDSDLAFKIAEFLKMKPSEFGVILEHINDYRGK